MLVEFLVVVCGFSVGYGVCYGCSGVGCCVGCCGCFFADCFIGTFVGGLGAGIILTIGVASAVYCFRRRAGYSEVSTRA